MNMFLRLAFLFFVGCVLGWILELFYRRIVGKKWVNPGLLKGPYLPIYGLGLALMYLICLVDFSFISIIWLQHVVRILFIGIIMTLIELIGGLIFINGMGIKLWDYSMRWGNFKGVICPLFSFIWTAIGALYYYVLHHFVLSWIGWFDNNIQFSFIVGLFFGIFIIDFITTMQVASKIKEFAAESGVIVVYEKLKAEIQEKKRAAKEKIKFLDFANPLRGDIKNVLNSLNSKNDKLFKFWKKNKKDDK